MTTTPTADPLTEVETLTDTYGNTVATITWHGSTARLDNAELRRTEFGHVVAHVLNPDHTVTRYPMPCAVTAFFALGLHVGRENGIPA